MTSIVAGQTVALLSQWYAYEGGPLTDLDATPTITITSVATGTTVLAATTAGVTHPGAGTYGYSWTPSTGLAPGPYLVQWSGAKAGSPVAASEVVTVTASLTGRSYATPEQLAAYLHADAPANAAKLLEDATRALDDALLTAVYDVDPGGSATSPAVQAAFAEAVCAIVEWWGETGDPVGADGGWDTVSAGPVSLGRSAGSQAATPIAGGSLPPRALSALRRLGFDVFRLGVATSSW
ncbi:hypothetical protein [Streptomyces sp. SAS_272]|uniref:hypothetical protein n=1 Tax=Streptomyces sp. SAS_272 TaxID=3412747 RepID=UPI00403CD8B0